MEEIADDPTEKSGTRSSVGLLDIATRVPGLLMDAPTIVRGVRHRVRWPGRRPRRRSARCSRTAPPATPTRSSSGSSDQELTYREANETVNRYAAVLAARGVGHGDVVGIMLRNSPQRGAADAGRGQVRRGRRHAQLPPARRGAGAQPRAAGRQGRGRRVRLGRRRSTRCGADTDGLMTRRGARASSPRPRRPSNPASASAVLAKDKAFYIFTSGTTGMPKASVMTHYRWLRALAGVRRARACG